MTKLVLAFLASSLGCILTPFLVMESAFYYQRLYPDQPWFPYIIGTFLEIGLVILTLLKVQGNAARGLQWLGIAAVFCGIVYGVTMGRVKPLAENVLPEHESRLVEIYSARAEAERKAAGEFGKRNPTNQAISIRKAREYEAKATAILERSGGRVTSLAKAEIFINVVIRILQQGIALVLWHTAFALFREGVREKQAPPLSSMDFEKAGQIPNMQSLPTLPPRKGDYTPKEYVLQLFPEADCVSMGEKNCIRVGEQILGQGANVPLAWGAAYRNLIDGNGTPRIFVNHE